MDDDERQESSCGDGARRPSLEEEQISNPEEEIVKCTRCSEQDAVVECRTCSPDCEDPPASLCSTCSDTVHLGKYGQKHVVFPLLHTLRATVAKLHQGFEKKNDEQKQHTNRDFQKMRDSINDTYAHLRGTLASKAEAVRQLFSQKESLLADQLAAARDRQLLAVGLQEIKLNSIFSEAGKVLSHTSQVTDMTHSELASLVPQLQQEFERSSALLDSIELNHISLCGFIPTFRLVEHSISQLSLYYENEWVPGRKYYCVPMGGLQTGGEFWLMPHQLSVNATLQETLATLSQTLSACMEQKPPEKNHYVTNSICCAYYSADQLWHRAVVCGRGHEGKVQVRYLDYGNTEEVYWNFIAPLPKEFLDLPFQCRKCSFAENADCSSDVVWKRESKWRYSDLTKTSRLTAELVKKVEPKGQNQIPTFYVKLSNSSGVDINEEVIKVTTNPPSKKVFSSRDYRVTQYASSSYLPSSGTTSADEDYSRISTTNLREKMTREERNARERSVSSISQDGDNEKEEIVVPTRLHPSSVPLPISAASSVHTSPSHQKLKDDKKQTSKLLLAAQEQSSLPLPLSQSSSVAGSPPPEPREQDEQPLSDHKVEEPPSEPSSEQNVEEPSSEHKVEEPSSEHKVEEPSSELKVEEPSSERKVEEPSSELKVEEPSSELKVVEPSSEHKVEEPLSVEEPTSVEEPSSEHKVEEPSSEHKVEETSSELKSLSLEEPSLEHKAYTPSSALVSDSSATQVVSTKQKNEENELEKKVEEVKEVEQDGEVKEVGKDEEVEKVRIGVKVEDLRRDEEARKTAVADKDLFKQDGQLKGLLPSASSTPAKITTSVSVDQLHPLVAVGAEVHMYVMSGLRTAGTFLAQLLVDEAEEDKYAAMACQLQEHATASDPYTPVFFSPGDLCMAVYEEDNTWYRGRVENVEQDVVTVTFMDYGNSEDVKLESVLPLHSNFRNLPFQAIHCSISTPDKDSFTDSECETFQSLIDPDQSSVLGRVTSIEGSLVKMNLFISNDDGTQKNILTVFEQSGQSRAAAGKIRSYSFELQTENHESWAETMDILSPGPNSEENNVFAPLLPSNVKEPEWEIASDGGRRGGDKEKTGGGRTSRKDSDRQKSRERPKSRGSSHGESKHSRPLVNKDSVRKFLDAPPSGEKKDHKGWQDHAHQSAAAESSNTRPVSPRTSPLLSHSSLTSSSSRKMTTVIMRRFPLSIKRDEIVAMFSDVGKVYDIRQVRKAPTYCLTFVDMCVDDAQKAVAKFNYKLFPNSDHFMDIALDRGRGSSRKYKY